MRIPVFNLTRQYRQIQGEINKAVKEVLSSGSYILGENVCRFEREFAGYCGVQRGVGVASGTDALSIALRACDIKEGDEVITTPFTFVATTEAINNVGAKIVFADIDLESYNIDPREIEKRLTPRTRAILCVHLYGQPCDMRAITKLVRKHNLKLIEDCAQATGAEYQGKKVGAFGDIGCFSFYPTKNLGAFGDGGMLVTDKSRLAEEARMLRQYGSKDRCHYPKHGCNSRLDELQAAILRVKLKFLDQWNKSRNELADYYNEKLRLLEEEGLLVCPKQGEGTKHIYHLYVLRTKQRPPLTEFLKSQGINTAVHYLIPLHLQKIYRGLGYRRGDFPRAELAAGQIITFPLYPELKKEEVDYIVGALFKFFKRRQ